MLLTPNAEVSAQQRRMILFALVGAWLFLWTALTPAVLPTPVEVLQEFPALWNQEGLGQELLTSFQVNLEALILSALLSLPLAYLSRVPVVRPIAIGVSKLRFLSPAVFFTLLLFSLTTGHQVKVGMLVMGEMFFLVTTLVGIVDAVPDAAFDEARTLRMGPWVSTWYEVVRGTLPETLNAIRDNAAMGWAMVMMVEGIVRSEGGVGVLLVNQERHMNFAVVYAIAIAVVLVGIAQDYALSLFRTWACPEGA